jgi:hypothetical protein
MVPLPFVLRFRRLCLAHLAVFATAFCSAQDIKLHLKYVCNGERIYVDSCNMRDTSDTSTCMVVHPDHIKVYDIPVTTYETRATLKKLLPTCTQPNAASVVAEAAVQKKQQQVIDAQTPKYAPTQQITVADMQAELASGGSKDPQELAMRRCIAAGRLPSSCTGNALLGSFSKMITSMAPSVKDSSAPPAGPPPSGPTMAGVFAGPGDWRLDFVDGGVLVNCSFLAPNEETYNLKFEPNRTALTINTTPKALNLTFRADGTIVGPPGLVTIDGVIPSGGSGGSYTPGHSETQTYTTTERMSGYQVQPNSANVQSVQSAGGGMYDVTTTHTSTTSTPGQYEAGATTFAKKRATCPAVNLTSRGTSAGIQTMQTDLLKTVFGGNKGAPTPPGIRMQGIYAASTGFSLQFFPESVIVGCGPISARAYPYTVSATAGSGLIKVDAADHPLSVAIRADASLDPGSGPYQVHGRMITGPTISDNYTFLPLEQTCNLATLTPAKNIPSTGGTAPPSHP